MVQIGNVKFGKGKIGWILGPCALEERGEGIRHAESIKEKMDSLKIPFVFKASFDKANRTNGHSPRGVGLKKGIEIFKEIKDKFDLPIITDVHEVCQVKKIADVVDAIQIPAFLCRQTDLLKAAGETGLPVMIKKGQFMRGEDMKHAADKTGKNVILCERGNMMGYSDLVVDYRNLITMRQYAPVIFDATHCVQKMSAKGHSSDGERQYSLPLTKAALAVGIDGIFAEVHRFPSMAISDRETQIPISGLRTFVRKALDIDEDSP